jgi:uncharacterized protein (DUF4415 family)
MSRVVRKSLADSPMTAARKRRLAQVAARPDSKIDLSEIPPLKESFWENAVRNPFYRPVKQQLTVRLDADVVAWLRDQGRGYQTRLIIVGKKTLFSQKNYLTINSVLWQLPIQDIPPRQPWHGLKESSNESSIHPRRFAPNRPSLHSFLLEHRNSDQSRIWRTVPG